MRMAFTCLLFLERRVELRKCLKIGWLPIRITWVHLLLKLIQNSTMGRACCRNVMLANVDVTLSVEQECALASRHTVAS